MREEAKGGDDCDKLTLDEDWKWTTKRSPALEAPRL